MTNTKSFTKIIFISIIYFLLLTLRFYQTKPSEYPIGKEIVLSGILSQEPQVTGKTQRFSLNFVPIVTWNLPEFHYGDVLEAKGSITSEAKNGKTYRSMLFPKITVLGHTEGVILGKISATRKKIISFYARSLHEPAASLLTGIVLGVKTTLPNDFYANLKTTGTMHVVAASGMNVTIVAGFLMAICLRFLGRKKALVLSMMGILFYAALSGFSPSINRAAIMGLLYFLSSYLGRQNFGLLSLGIAGSLMIIINPFIVRDIGFQLSVMATLGLIVIQPRLRRFTTKIPFVSEALSTTLAAQIATLPILLVNFGRLSLWSPLVNTLVLWTIEPITIFGGIGAIFGLFFEPFGRLFIYLSYGFLVLFIEIVNFFGRIQLFSFAFDHVPVLFGVGWYLVVGSILFVSASYKKHEVNSLQ
jgi:competence protein ComEC